MACKGSRCLYDCSAGGNTLCGAISSTLACAPTVYDVPVCLPKGSFPGGPCDAASMCAQNLGGLASADMRCQTGVCVVQCASGSVLPFVNGDALCGAVSGALTCVDSAGAQAFCSLKCGEGNTCATGTSCLTSQGACLPTGSFLGSPCAGGTTCSGSPMLVCAPTGPSSPPICAAGCNSGAPQTGDGYCAALGGMLGTGFDKCIAAGPVEICVDSTP